MKHASLVGGLVLALGLLWAAPAGAIDWYGGYVCNVNYSKQANSFWGNDGYLWVTLLSEPKCGGTYVASAVYVTSGGSVSGYHYSTQERLVFFQRLHEAAIQGTSVTFGLSEGGGVYYNYFRAQ